MGKSRELIASLFDASLESDCSDDEDEGEEEMVVVPKAYLVSLQRAVEMNTARLNEVVRMLEVSESMQQQLVSAAATISDPTSSGYLDVLGSLGADGGVVPTPTRLVKNGKRT